MESFSITLAARDRARELVERVDDVLEACAVLVREFDVTDETARHLVLRAQVAMFEDLAGVA